MAWSRYIPRKLSQWFKARWIKVSKSRSIESDISTSDSASITSTQSAQLSVNEEYQHTARQSQHLGISDDWIYSNSHKINFTPDFIRNFCSDIKSIFNSVDSDEERRHAALQTQQSGSRNDLICPNCHNLTPDLIDKTHSEVESTWVYRDFESLNTLRTTVAHLEASQHNCSSCLLILTSIRKYAEHISLSNYNEVIFFRECTFLKGPIGHLTMVVNPREGFSVRPLDLEFYTTEGQQSFWSVIGPSRGISAHPLSTECVDLATSWLNECIESARHGAHKRCTRYKETILPTRVLDVGSAHRNPFLLATNGLVGKYVALSYCWGASLPLTTTKSTKKSRERGIPYSELPKTLQHAVDVARAYNVQYLWIDALCIVQDSKKDWEEQSAKMGEIYANAYFVIAADAAKDCQDGFLRERNVHDGLLSIEITSVSPSKGTEQTFVRRAAKIPVIGDVNEVSQRQFPIAHSVHSNYAGRLFSRGWVFQERSLAQRTLIFSADELAWECRSLTRCECHLAVGDSGNHYLDCRSLRKKDPFELISTCSRLASSYTRLDLTKRSDRLSAFSGIASFICRHSTLTFVAGLWRQQLPWQLMWFSGLSRTNFHTVTSERHEKYQAPSWSWASLTGPISYDMSNYILRILPTFHVLDISCQLASHNPYGPVSKAQIKLRGQVCAVKLIQREVGNGSLGLELQGFAESDPEVNRKDMTIEDCVFPDVTGNNLEISFGEFYLLLLVCLQYRSDTGVLPVAIGLILRPSKRRRCLERIGNFYHFGYINDVCQDYFEHAPVAAVDII